MFNGIKFQTAVFIFLALSAGYCDSLPNCNVHYAYNQIDGQLQNPFINNGQPITISWNGGIEVIATIIIDSLANNKVAFSILSLSQIDTSVYYSTPKPVFSQDTSTKEIVYDTSGFPRHHIDSLIAFYNPGLFSGQQFKNVFILQISPYNGLRYWCISKAKECFLTEVSSSFSLNNALSYLNTFINQNNILKGYSPPNNGVLKLGPIFPPQMGDPTWGLTAYNDSINWYFNQYAGYGDCPAGCTEVYYIFYIVSKDGVVKLDSAHCTPFCPQTMVISNKPKNQISNNIGFGSSKIYSISGRYIAKIPLDQKSNLNSFMAKLGLKQGVYLVKNENGGVMRLIRFEKSR